MEFDKNRIYTVVNAYELQIGSRCIFADTMDELKIKLRNVKDYIDTLDVVCSDRNAARFYSRNATYFLAYLIEPPADPRHKPFSNMENAVEVVKKHGGWIKRKTNNSLLFITGFTSGGIFLGNNYHYDFISLFREFIFADDCTPCGELVEE